MNMRKPMTPTRPLALPRRSAAAGLLPAALAVLGILIALSALAGCDSSPAARAPGDGEYVTVASDPRRNTEAARVRNARAVGMIEDGRLELAEAELKAALKSDVFFGPAHNNLGLVYHAQKKFYLAAWEFQYAAKLMPHKAEPRNNLGLVLETVGKLDEATAHYNEALAIEPDNAEVIGNLARARIRDNQKDDQTRELLADLILKDTRPEWTTWARQTLAEMGQPVPNPTEPLNTAPPQTEDANAEESTGTPPTTLIEPPAVVTPPATTRPEE